MTSELSTQQALTRRELIGATLLFCIVFFGLGIGAGFLIGYNNAEIDFCDDNSAPRYIVNDAARAQSCAAGSVRP